MVNFVTLQVKAIFLAKCFPVSGNRKYLIHHKEYSMTVKKYVNKEERERHLLGYCQKTAGVDDEK